MSTYDKLEQFADQIQNKILEDAIDVVDEALKMQPRTVMCACGTYLLITDRYLDYESNLHVQVAPCKGCAKKEEEK